MRILSHAVATAVALVFVGALAGTAQAAETEAPEAALSCIHKLIRGSGGHHGAAMTCHGGSFTGVILAGGTPT
ncbi:hypothetical protein CDO52_15715 [Nocardiopsis gilva YIM 90087]|uniref:Uncharacterized protein n=1 Tax=Nocardiopsis gilva YIM 90087 TaxID=1235441 RepID=A0A223S7G0_9ACTN|nr:hypothetical protein [Nocardiopsis gilva]ASU84043.1 hypothetical protein CDO52_15715 [Nocardiopsis gilva YIM 90087]